MRGLSACGHINEDFFYPTFVVGNDAPSSVPSLTAGILRTFSRLGLGFLLERR